VSLDDLPPLDLDVATRLVEGEDEAVVEEGPDGPLGAGGMEVPAAPPATGAG
jgi:hypothetical protein